jgi:putative endonuclease
MSGILAQSKGAAGEQLAADYLQRRGLTLVERNFRVRGGEIDLVCRDGTTTVFVEVRLRSRERFRRRRRQHHRRPSRRA